MDIHGKMEIVLLEYMERIVFGEYPTQTLPMLPLTELDIIHLNTLLQ